MKTSLYLMTAVMIVASTATASRNMKDSEGVYRRRTEPQQVTLIDSGIAALKKRLDMIENAKKSIEMEYFIYSIDSAGRLITDALIRKARQGVKVRVIVDTSLPIFELNKYYASVLKEAGIEVHYYNPAVLVRVVTVQFRSHRKTLIVDGIEGITGGRNIADEYFDLSSEYNFLDTDIVVKGSIVKDMLTSFEEFWNAEITENAPIVREPQPEDFYGITKETMNDPNTLHDKDARISVSRYHADKYYYDKGSEKAAAFKKLTAEDLKNRRYVDTFGAQMLAKQASGICNDMIFAADFPGMGEKTRVLRKQLAVETSLAEKKVFIESPYFVVKKEISSILHDLLRRNIEINVVSNSLYSTDAFYTQAIFDTRIRRWTELGVNVWMHKGHVNQNVYPLIPEARSARWGTHSKRAVIDDKTIIVGTFNMDPRSTNINAEMALICRDNPKLALALQNNIKEHIASSAKLNRAGFREDGQPMHENVPVSKKVLFWMTLPLASVLDFLL
ncbi:phosphatidylserine/phosphatidylglycerophosphate/cardiolipin synthase family protein [Bdellovibrio sp. KM01]|uniref:phospholipase D-like domain-containing protein n=1 Tax=Bdellovibrio sp. KM01 TaxID=2748865 RepID=UPI0015E9D4BF|nr:phospholipase D family protein [Bdellovibrio sp. KM01]QLY24536.1 phospholipase D family protein [Bdellovibrio sp. KM01]